MENSNSANARSQGSLDASQPEQLAEWQSRANNGENPY